VKKIGERDRKKQTTAKLSFSSLFFLTRSHCFIYISCTNLKYKHKGRKDVSKNDRDSHEIEETIHTLSLILEYCFSGPGWIFLFFYRF